MDANKRIKEDPTQNEKEESKVIAEFHISPPQDKNAQMLEDYNSCCLCGSDLEFTHVTNFVELDVLEEARCPCCNIRSKKESHILQ